MRVKRRAAVPEHRRRRRTRARHVCEAGRPQYGINCGVEGWLAKRFNGRVKLAGRNRGRRFCY